MRFLAVFVLLGSVLLAASVSADEELRLQIAAVKEEPGELTVVVSAFDGDGNPLADLTPANFRAALDETSLSILSIDIDSAERITTGVVLLVDVSGSMLGEPMIQAKAAMQEFVLNLDPQDEVAILAFASEVTEIQDFTTDRNLLFQAIDSLEPLGNTALYDAVIDGTRKASEFKTARQMLVFLSDGLATVNQEKRAESVIAAATSGAIIVAVGLGDGVDVEYLTEITEASGGLLLEADTPAALRQEYIDLAVSLRNQYTLHIAVPPSVDRTVAATLSIRIGVRVESAVAEVVLEPLTGAISPPFTLTVSGLVAGQEINSTVTVVPDPMEEVTIAKVDYYVGDELVFTANEAPFSFQLDGSIFESGTQLLRIEATDTSGRVGGTQVAFAVPLPPPVSQFDELAPTFVIGGAVIFVVLLIALLISRRKPRTESFVDRVRPWEGKVAEDATSSSSIEEWPEAKRAVAPAPVQELGRLVVMNEAAIRNGDLSAIHDFPVGGAPVTLGTASSCEIRVEDEAGEIAGEEARLWIQRGRLVYHKLTTLSAMATTGVQSGWLFLEDGEEIRLGEYRLLFQAEAATTASDGVVADQEVQLNPPNLGLSPEVEPDTLVPEQTWPPPPDDPSLNPQSS